MIIKVHGGMETQAGTLQLRTTTETGAQHYIACVSPGIGAICPCSDIAKLGSVRDTTAIQAACTNHEYVAVAY